jgi:FAD-linked oxidoreductase
VAQAWTNWARQQRCAPETIERPATEADARAAVKRAVERGLRVRAAGAGHSFTDIACTDGVLFDLSRMCEVLHADAASGLARVQAGVSLQALGPRLAERGLALENQGDIDRQTLAGSLATATHGTGVRFGNLSSRVASLRLITGEGEVVELSEDSDPDGWRAARVGLGALGIVTEVTLRCVPLFTLTRQDQPRPLHETLAELDRIVDDSDHFEFFVFPYSEIALTRRSSRSDEEPRPSEEWKVWVQEQLLENAALEALCRVGRAAPQLIPRVNRLIASTLTGSRKIDRSWRVFPTRRWVRFTEMEYAIPRACARSTAPDQLSDRGALRGR